MKFLWSWLWPTFLSASMITTSQLEDLLEHAEGDTIIFSDIDNTLLESKQHLGSVACGEFLVDSLKQKGVKEEEAIKIEHILWKTIQPHVAVQLVDHKALDVIAEIHQRKQLFIGMTARAPYEQGYTSKQIQSLGIMFSNPCPRFELPLNNTALFDDGIIYGTTYNKKSEVLFAFLDALALAPRRIVFVDDKRHHLEGVQEECQKRGIEYVGIHFIGALSQFDRFDPEIARQEWEKLPES